MLSWVVGAVGVLASGAAIPHLGKRIPESKPHHYWFLGLAGLFPAWLIAFLNLLEPVAREAGDVPLPPRALFSSAVGLLGIIATDYLLRRFQKSGGAFPPLAYWLLGGLALLPAWLIASVGF